MTTIEVFPQAAGQAGRAMKFEQKNAPVSTLSSDQAHSNKSQEMMHAWSIGITSAAREMREMRHEECPPEVYIG